jgi:hypothetical protein
MLEMRAIEVECKWIKDFIVTFEWSKGGLSNQKSRVVVDSHSLLVPPCLDSYSNVGVDEMC